MKLIQIQQIGFRPLGFLSFGGFFVAYKKSQKPLDSLSFKEKSFGGVYKIRLIKIKVPYIPQYVPYQYHTVSVIREP